jgi:hypothetical protein
MERNEEIIGVVDRVKRSGREEALLKSAIDVQGDVTLIILAEGEFTDNEVDEICRDVLIEHSVVNLDLEMLNSEADKVFQRVTSRIEDSETQSSDN